MASKGYSRFEDDDDGWGVDIVEGTAASTGGVRESHTDEGPAGAEQLDFNLKENDGLDRAGVAPDDLTEGDAGLGEMGRSPDGEWDGGGEGGGGGGGDGDDDAVIHTRSRRWTYAAFYEWIMSNAVMLYTSQLLSAWGDRMWSFTVALYLVEIEEQSLRLTAIYGLFISGSALVFGAAIGRWVDRTPRLRAARTSLIVQNSCVLVNACLLCTVLLLKPDILPIWNGGLYIFCQLVIIVLGTLASLASLAEVICIQKDWVVVVAGNDKDVLAVLNANMRRIDLVSNILAPIAVGAIMTASMLVGGIFVAAWNGVSMVIEYWNLWRVYKNVPGLAVKGGVECIDDPNSGSEVRELDEAAVEAQGQCYLTLRNTNDSEKGQRESTNLPADSVNVPSSSTSSQPATKENNEPGATYPAPFPQNSQVTMATKDEEEGEGEFMEIPPPPSPSATASSEPFASSSSRASGVFGDCCGRITAKLKDMFDGWKVYKSYTEFWAGLGMAFIYMTVLGFDSITIGYGYSQGMPEYAMGILQALGSITGILGTLIYPFMRRRIGLERAGLYAIWTQIAFLMLCVGSLWAPGSPFIYDYGNSTNDASLRSSPPLSVTTPLSPTSNIAPPTTVPMTTPATDPSTAQCKFQGSEDDQSSLVSAAILFSGIVLSRIGLWAFDLTVTQLIQENVLETERGVFNGVQRALECIFEMIHFVLVIALPCPETFGYLVLVSVLFVVCGACNYMVYSYKRRGHLIHVEKITPCLQNGHV